MAADEKDAKLKADLEKQAAAYRKLAVQRAKLYKLDRDMPCVYRKPYPY